MSYITKTIRLTGTSENSIEEAVTTALGRASSALEDVMTFRVVEIEGTVDASGTPAEYSVTLDVAFVVRESVVEH